MFQPPAGEGRPQHSPPPSAGRPSPPGSRWGPPALPPPPSPSPPHPAPRPPAGAAPGEPRASSGAQPPRAPLHPRTEPPGTAARPRPPPAGRGGPGAPAGGAPPRGGRAAAGGPSAKLGAPRSGAEPRAERARSGQQRAAGSCHGEPGEGRAKREEGKGREGRCSFKSLFPRSPALGLLLYIFIKLCNFGARCPSARLRAERSGAQRPVPPARPSLLPPRSRSWKSLRGFAGGRSVPSSRARPRRARALRRGSGALPGPSSPSPPSPLPPPTHPAPTPPAPSPRSRYLCCRCRCWSSSACGRRPAHRFSGPAPGSPGCPWRRRPPRRRCCPARWLRDRGLPERTPCFSHCRSLGDGELLHSLYLLFPARLYGREAEGRNASVLQMGCERAWL